MRRTVILVAVAALLVSLPVVAGRVQLVIKPTLPPAVLDGTDFIYVQHGWIGEPNEDGIYGFEEYGYRTFPVFARACLGYRLYIGDDEVDVTKISFSKDGPVTWQASWCFFFRPRSLPAGTYEFTGVYEWLELDGTWATYARTRQVTIEY